MCVSWNRLTNDTRSRLCWYLQEPRLWLGFIRGKLYMCVMTQPVNNTWSWLCWCLYKPTLTNWTQIGNSIYIFKKKKKKKKTNDQWHQVIFVSVPVKTLKHCQVHFMQASRNRYKNQMKPRLCPWPHSQLIHSSQWKSRQDVSSGPDPIHQLQRHQQTLSSPHPIFPLRTDHSKLLRHLECLQISNTDECLGGVGVGGGRTPNPWTVLNTTQPTALSDVRQGCGGGAGKAAVGLPPRPGEDTG